MNPFVRMLLFVVSRRRGAKALGSFSLLVAMTCGVVTAAETKPAAEAGWIGEAASKGSFALATDAATATICVANDDATVVRIAADDLAADVERVAGKKPTVVSIGAGTTLPAGSLVLIGTLGKSPVIDALVASGKLDVAALRGTWETFLIATVENPMPHVKQALVIVGSDRRGTAYGVYELSQAIGVSPWHWWADVVPPKKAALHVAAGTRKFGPPSVQYRGIFINDEDWGLQPWAAQTFSPEEGGIGPKVYRKVFELLLRLKANTLWPAMHECTKPFNAFPENAKLADDYAIVMGSSHAEPMLRNNVGEWKDPKPDYSYVTNREGVRKYWEERVKTNGRFENVYTLGMRGIHDSGIQGAKTDAERIAVLEQVFADQRAMLAQHVSPKVEQIPQMFCAYKEVLDLYRQGLKVPEDVTIVWPDDNFGYIRNFASPEEQKRSGGFGVYYHISYLGRPLSYLWLNTTPPALIWEEMTKAYAHGARKIWIVNVGDIKPAEIGTEFFLQLAWDVNRWGTDAQQKFLEAWATREFGAEDAQMITWWMTRYFQQNFQRKPEHLQWWLPKTEPVLGPFSSSAFGNERLKLLDHVVRVPDADQYSERLDLNDRMPPTETRALLERSSRLAQTAAFRQLVEFPVNGSALAWERFLHGELATLTNGYRHGDGGAWAEYARAADRVLTDLNAEMNQLADEKWKGFYQLEPADKQWASMRISPWMLLESKSTSSADPRLVLDGDRLAGATSGPTREFRMLSSYLPYETRIVEVYGAAEVLKNARILRTPRWIEGSFVEKDHFPVGRRFYFRVDWKKAPRGERVLGQIEFFDGVRNHTLTLPIQNPAKPNARDLVGGFVELDGIVSIEAENFRDPPHPSGGLWFPIPGLGRTGGAVTPLFHDMPKFEHTPAKFQRPTMVYPIHFFSRGEFTLQANLIPTHPIRGDALRFAVALDNGALQLVELKFQDGSADWAQGVLSNTRVATTKFTVDQPGNHHLWVYGVEPGVVIDKFVLYRGELPPSYLGPPETRVVVEKK